MAHFIHLVADFGTGDLAFGEVIQRLKTLIPNVDVHPTSVKSFDTLGTGFIIAQYGLGPHPENMCVYSNTAPRKDNKEAREHNAGEGFMYAKLDNGVEVLAVNAGYCFSFIKPHIKELRHVNVNNHGSQFRSRDFYPQAVADHLSGKAVLGEAVSPEYIEDVPENRLAWIDGYGNLKTTIRKSQVSYQPGDKVKISINGIIRTALVAGGNFSVAEGELSFSPGSSGYDDPFMELFLRGGSAERLFEFPRDGAPIKFK